MTNPYAASDLIEDADTRGQEPGSAVFAGLDGDWVLETFAERDWASTSLGAVADWPSNLRCALSTALRCPVPMALLWGSEGILLYNTAYSQIIGDRHPAILGLPVRDAWPEVADFNQDILESVLRGETRSFKDQELVLVRHGKAQPAYFDLDYSPVVDDMGKPSGVLAIVVETTGKVTSERERLAAETGLARREEHWQGLFEELHEGFILGQLVRDDAGKVIDWVYLEVNAAFGRLVNRLPSDTIGRTIREVFPGVEEAWISRMHDAVRLEKTVTFVDRVASLDRWYEGHAFPLGEDRFCIMFVDATERLRNERVLERGRQRLQAAVDLAQLGMFELDVETRRIELDERALNILDLTGEGPWRDADILQKMNSENAKAAQDVIATAISTRSRVDGILKLRRSDGSRKFAHAMASILEDDNGIRLSGVIADVTEQREFESRLKLINQELRHRVNNLFAVVQSLISTSSRGESDAGLLARKLQERVAALSIAHGISMNHDRERSNILAEIVKAISQPYESLNGSIRTSGPDVSIPERAITPLGLILHELATNCVKYGAWSHPDGVVDVEWEVSGAGDHSEVMLSWKEHGSTKMKEPSGVRNFGSRLMDASAMQINARVERDWTSRGLHFRLAFAVDA
ncbi:PAS domain-containing sensor histidine kinase [Roseivivax sp. CAU 1761]